MINQKQIKHFRKATIAEMQAIDTLTNDDMALCFCEATSTLYRHLTLGLSYAENYTSVIAITGTNERWIGIAGKYICTYGLANYFVKYNSTGTGITEGPMFYNGPDSFVRLTSQLKIIGDTTTLENNLNEPDFATYTKWMTSVNGDWVISTGKASYVWQYGNGTLLQLGTDQAIPLEPYTWYKLTYTMANVVGDPNAVELVIGTFTTDQSVPLKVSNGVHSVLFKTNDLTSSGQFCLFATGSGGIAFDITSLIVNAVTGGDLEINGIAEYTSHPTFTKDEELVDKKYVDDEVAGMSLWKQDGGLITPISELLNVGIGTTGRYLKVGNSRIYNTGDDGIALRTLDTFTKGDTGFSGNGNNDIILTGTYEGLVEDTIYIRILAGDNESIPNTFYWYNDTTWTKSQALQEVANYGAIAITAGTPIPLDVPNHSGNPVYSTGYFVDFVYNSGHVADDLWSFSVTLSDIISARNMLQNKMFRVRQAMGYDSLVPLDDTIWVGDTDIIIGSNSAVYTSTGSLISETFSLQSTEMPYPLEAGENYLFEYDVINDSIVSETAVIPDTVAALEIPLQITTGHHTVIFEAIGGTDFIVQIDGASNAGATLTFSNVSCRRIQSAVASYLFHPELLNDTDIPDVKWINENFPQSDWAVTDSASVAYIANKPSYKAKRILFGRTGGGDPTESANFYWDDSTSLLFAGKSSNTNNVAAEVRLTKTRGTTPFKLTGSETLGYFTFAGLIDSGQAPLAYLKATYTGDGTTIKSEYDLMIGDGSDIISAANLAYDSVTSKAQLSTPMLKVTGLPSYADDAAAATGGLVAGQLYQTSGSGAAPLNVAGIVMVKQ